MRPCAACGGRGRPNTKGGVGGVDQERMTILRLLEEKKVTAEEAADLLRALEAPAPRPRLHFGDMEEVGRRAERMVRRGEEMARRGEQMAERVPEMVERLMGRMEFGGLPFFGPSFRFDESIEGELAEGALTARLHIDTSNGKVRLQATDEARRVRVVLHKTVRAATEGEARTRAAGLGSATVTGEEVTVTGDGAGWFGGAYGLSVDVFLPRAVAWGGSVRTSNGRIEAESLNLRDAKLESSNGRIQLASCTAADLSARTSNGRIEARRVSGRIRLETSNGSLEVQVDPAEGENVLDLHTSNGPIRIEGPLAGTGWRVDADTSGGHIHADLPGVEVAQNRSGWTRASAHGATPDYEAQARRIHCSARTHNGSITVGTN